MTSNEPVDHGRLEEIEGIIREFTRGNLKTRGTISGKKDVIDVVIAALNELGEDLLDREQERRKSEDALKESEELHRITLSNISDAVFLTDDEGDFIFICPNVAVIFGYSVPEVGELGNISTLLGQGFFERFKPDDKKEIRNIEIEITDKGGESHTLLVNVKRVSIKGGTILYVCRDVTDRRETERALRETEVRYRLLVESLQEGLGIVNDNEEILFANPAFSRIMGYSKDELVGMNLFEFVTERDSGKIEEETQKRKKGNSSEYELEIMRKDGESRVIQIFATPWKNKDDIFRGTIGLILDITDRKRMEEKLKHHAESLEEEVQRRTKELIRAKKLASIGQLVTGIAHEINSPLAVISLYAELLSVDNRDDKSTKYINIICDHVNSASRIVSGLLDFTRISKMERVNLDVNEIILKVMGIIGHQLSLVRIETTLDLAQSLPLVFADPDQLNQVILNIVMNAYHAVEKDGSISITTKKINDRMVEIKITDTGKGISGKNRKRIFEPFYTTKTSGSTGLGLSISKEIIDSHGGTIGFKSEKGKGTSFTVRLPVISGQ